MAAQEILVLLVAVRARLPQQKNRQSAGFFIEVGSHPLSLCDIPLEGDMPLSASQKTGGSVAPVLRTLALFATALQRLTIYLLCPPTKFTARFTAYADLR